MVIGNGDTVRCWKDPWIPDMGPLIYRIPDQANINLDSLRSEMINDEGYWDLELFSFWLSEEIIKRIVGLPPPHPFAGLDRIIWA